MKIGHVKIDRAHFRVHFREHWTISREHWKSSLEHSRGSPRGDPQVRFAQKKTSSFMGISVDIFVYTPVCIFVSTSVREFAVQISTVRVLCACLSLLAETQSLLVPPLGNGISPIVVRLSFTICMRAALVFFRVHIGWMPTRATCPLWLSSSIHLETGTVGTVFQEPKPEPEPSFPVNLY